MCSVGEAYGYFVPAETFVNGNPREFLALSGNRAEDSDDDEREK
jgi:hypothetical protein